jgi:DNA topoisomerase IA
VIQLNKKEIEMDKLKRAEMTKVVNSRMWAKRAERKKREGEMSLIEQMQEEGLGVADLMKSRKAQNKEEESDDEEL